MKRTATSEIIEQIRDEIAKLAVRLDALEGFVGQTVGGRSAAGPQAGPQADSESIPDDILAAISACLAAYMGERFHIRQIRLVASPAWAQQGRVSIQASHRLY
jgi:methylmalonyl-CoA carboxyltransferase 12S subunit